MFTSSYFKKQNRGLEIHSVKHLKFILLHEAILQPTNLFFVKPFY